ncbi:hypothetical protein OCU04_011942 [Sclerotinia nivalis]|uniref:Uncharacterized protein n=1 Tax=Sclerotinia nivalis TaxID=352851 RepID=A0A9X0AB56_9HELO|nr:hypothetical protein OCU04_011942 [Sclerotinia nivalis]
MSGLQDTIRHIRFSSSLRWTIPSITGRREKYKHFSPVIAKSIKSGIHKDSNNVIFSGGKCSSCYHFSSTLYGGVDWMLSIKFLHRGFYSTPRYSNYGRLGLNHSGGNRAKDFV